MRARLRSFAWRLAAVLLCAVCLLIATGGHWMAWLGSVSFVAGMLGEAYMRVGRLSVKYVAKNGKDDERC